MNRIKEVLKKQGRSQQWLSEQIGKSYNMTNLYVTNKTQPSLDLLFEIAKHLGVDVKDLIVDKKD